jgi:AraC-like DNA-binding protein
MTIEQHLTLHEFLLPPSGEWAPRGEGWIILRVAEGFSYLLQRGGAVRELNAGDCVVMAHRGNGSFRASRLGPLKLQFFLIDPQSLNGLFTLAEGRRLEAAFEGTSPHVSVFTSQERVALEFARIAAQPHTDGLPNRCQFVQLWAEAIAKLLAAPIPPAANSGELRERLRQMIGRMSEAELAECSLQDLAARLHCSERHFGRLFREEFEVPLHQRQIELRLLRARQLLTNSDAKIVNVAYDSGYRHLGLFNTMFKKRFGVTPSEWRRQNARENLPARPRNRP